MREAWTYRTALLWAFFGLIGASAPLLAFAALADWAYPYTGNWGWVIAFTLWIPTGTWIGVRAFCKALDAHDEAQGGRA